MEPRLLRPGALLRVRFPGETSPCDAVLDRILDRHGRRLDAVDLDAPPPHAVLVIVVDGLVHCVPLWPADAAQVPCIETGRRAG